MGRIGGCWGHLGGIGEDGEVKLEQWMNVKNAFFAALSLSGAAVVEAFGGWDGQIQTLLWCMALDYCTGMLLAGVFKRSMKSADGALNSRAGYRGLCKKGGELAVVLLAARLDEAIGGSFSRTAVILFFTANEGLSILENLGLMGVPYPAFLRDALEVLREKGESDAGNG